MTRPKERLPQRQLVLELRYLIDTARREEELVARGGPDVAKHAQMRLPGAIQRVKALVDEHPLGIQSGHVQHNLGYNRLRWAMERGLLLDGVTLRTPDGGFVRVVGSGWGAEQHGEPWSNG